MSTPIGPTDSSLVSVCWSGDFARLPRTDEVAKTDIAVVGIPFDSGVSYRPGARFGPAAIREASRLLRPYNPGLMCPRSLKSRWPTAVTSRSTRSRSSEAIATVEASASELLSQGTRLVTLVETTRSRCRCSAPCTGTGRWRSCTSTPIWTRGTPISVSLTRTAPRSAVPWRRGFSTRKPSPTWGSAALYGKKDLRTTAGSVSVSSPPRT